MVVKEQHPTYKKFIAVLRYNPNMAALPKTIQRLKVRNTWAQDLDLLCEKFLPFAKLQNGSDLIIRKKSEDLEFGLFAKRRIRRGEPLFDVRGWHLENTRDKTFLVLLDDGTCGLDGPFCFLNHSCDPNCETLIVDNEYIPRAVRDIEMGEELTVSLDTYFDERGLD